MEEWAVWYPALHKDSLSLRVVLSPDGLELIQVVRAQNGPVPCEVVKVVHDDSHKEVDDLQKDKGAHSTGRWGWGTGTDWAWGSSFKPVFQHIPQSVMSKAEPCLCSCPVCALVLVAIR